MGGGCFDGTFRTSMVLCLSPENTNGWETWFSLEFAKAVQQLKVPTKKQTKKSLRKAIQNSKEEEDRMAEQLKNTNKNSKYFTRKETLLKIYKFKVCELKRVLQTLQRSL